MKRIFLILALLILAATSYGAVEIHNNIRKNGESYERIINFACKELNIDSAVIIINDSNFDMKLSYSVDNGMAAVRRLDLITFVINIDATLGEKWRAKYILHELVHVKQMLMNRLKVFGAVAWFEGETYTNKNSTYENRPYEIEAEEEGMKLYKKYREYIKK